VTPNKTPLIRIPLSDTYNTRDLGGYPTKDNKVTLFNRFIRSDFIRFVQPEDIILLKEKNVGVVIDLRTMHEIEKEENSLEKIDFLVVYKLPLFDEFGKYRKNNSDNDPLYKLYISILEHEQDNIIKVFETMLNHPDQAILFHCTAGKDRTGVIAMLLLGLANAYDNDIISNYEISHTHTKARSDIKQLSKEIPYAYFESNPQTIEKTLVYFYKNYVGFKQYFEILGFDDDKQKELLKGFIEE
jgi:protein-tyrosine phosphatase